MSDSSAARKYVTQFVKWTLCAVVLWFVVDRATELWQQSPDDLPPLSPGWLIAAAGCYIAGWLPSVWFMHALLARLGHRPGWLPLASAYYCGHLGKYVPGKATVLLIRSGMLKPHGVPVAQSALGVVVETLGVMAVGLAVSAALSGWVFPESVWQQLPESVRVVRQLRWLGPATVGAGVLILVPLCAGIASRVAVRLAGKQAKAVADSKAATESDADPVESSPPIDPSCINPRLLFLGTAAFTVAWLLFGLSLGCVLLSLHHTPASAADWLNWTAAVAAGTSLGFIVLFAPGGLGVREGLIIAVLEPSVGGKLAVAAAALLRVIWFASEVIGAAVLYFTPLLLRRHDRVPPAGKDGK